jgi:4-amino-4-deoxy-L-arabinose transferase-like glycosyltransferase
MASDVRPETSAPRQQAPRRAVPWLALSVLLLIVLRLPGFLVPMDQDSGCYAHIGMSWVRGELPYRDVWDHKPPAIYVVTAGVQLLTGSVSPTGMRACAVVFGIGTLLLVYGLASRLLGPRQARVAALVYAVASSGLLVTRETLETEHPMVFFALLSVWCLVLASERWRAWPLFAAGLSAGASVMFKPVSAPLIGLAFLWLLWRQRHVGAVVSRGLAAVALTGAGCLVVPGAFALGFASAGILDDFIGAFRYNFMYRAAAEYGGGAAEEVAILLARVKQLAPEQGWLILLAVVGAVRLFRRREQGKGLLLLWVLGAALGAAAAGRFYAYYFLPLTAALAPLAAVALLRLYEEFRATPAPRWADARNTLAAILLVGLGAYGLRHEWHLLRTLRSDRSANVVLTRMARDIRASTQPDARIFVWGTRQQVYALAQRAAPTRYTYDAPFRHRSAAQRFFGEEVYAQMAEAIRSARCPFIIVTDPNALAPFPELRELLDADYRLVEKAKDAELPIELYRRQPPAEEDAS